MQTTDSQETPRPKISEMPEEMLNDLIGRWHDGAGEGLELHEFLGCTLEEYKAWVERR